MSFVLLLSAVHASDFILMADFRQHDRSFCTPGHLLCGEQSFLGLQMHSHTQSGVRLLLCGFLSITFPSLVPGLGSATTTAVFPGKCGWELDFWANKLGERNVGGLPINVWTQLILNFIAFISLL